jgi:outer membrane receptor protein involved in Fe transport
MIRFLLGAGFAAALAAPASAQTATLSGTIVDESAAVVPGATVTLTGTGVRASTISGARGEYTFRNLSTGTYQVAVSLPGFAPATRDNIVVNDSSVEVSAITLTVATVGETVIVSASKVESTLINAPATMTVLSSDVLASTPALNYGDLLRSVPGVNVIQMSARDVNLTTREATSTLSNSELVVLDGRSIVLDFFGLVLWDFIPSNLADIKQVEVIRGPASAVWGTNALTGVVNVITKPPRQTLGTTVTLTGGLFSRDAGSGLGRGLGTVFGANATVAEAPNDRWSYRVSAGYFNSESLPRPTGRIPVIIDPRDPTATVGGAVYPIDGQGPVGTAFQNKGTSQPKFDMRVDEEIAGGRITYGGGVAGTAGLIHTGLGPFDIQPGAHMGYGKVNYNKGAFKLSAFANFVNADAPSLLLNNPTTGKPLRLNFTTDTYDLELGHALVAAKRHAISFGGNVRRNNFDVEIAPTATNRNEVGTYVQDEIFLDRLRFTVGGRVDKFGNISGPVFSPRLTAMFKPTSDHAIRVSYNKAFRSPSMINNYEDIRVVVPTDLSGLAPLLPPELQPAVAAPFPLVVRAVGSKLPIGTTPQKELTEESLTAYELAYIGTFKDRTTLTAAFYVNDLHNSINFTQLPNNLDPYTPANPPPGWPLPPVILGALAQQGIFLPQTAFTYLNLGPLRQKGIELSADHRINAAFTTFANYSWQGKPTPLPDPNPFPKQELALPPTNRLNLGFNFNGLRFLGSASLNHSGKAFWTDVLSGPFHGFSDAYTMVNGSLGVKWADRKLTTRIKVTNLLNRNIQQHVFGDILKRSGVAEVQFRF